MNKVALVVEETVCFVALRGAAQEGVGPLCCHQLLQNVPAANV